MNKTTILAEFIVSKDGIFPTEEFTEKLLINPARSYNIGDRVEDIELYRKFTCWCVATSIEESRDINHQLSKLINILEPKTNSLIELKEVYNVDYVFSITIDIENGEKPAIYLEPKSIGFLNSIGAEIDIDLII